jgi:hypothetical protein
MFPTHNKADRQFGLRLFSIYSPLDLVSSVLCTVAPLTPLLERLGTQNWWMYLRTSEPIFGKIWNSNFWVPKSYAKKYIARYIHQDLKQEILF